MPMSEQEEKACNLTTVQTLTIRLRHVVHQFSHDLPEAESQKHNLEGVPIMVTVNLLTFPLIIFLCSEPVPSDKKPPKETNAAASDQAMSSNSPYATHYCLDIPIWSLYLKEMEAEDKELILLWETGLDSLLVFVSSNFLPVQGQLLTHIRLVCLQKF